MLMGCGFGYRWPPPTERRTPTWCCLHVRQSNLKKGLGWAACVVLELIGGRGPLKDEINMEVMMGEKSSGSVDTRVLNSGHIRLRFKLNESANLLVAKTMQMTGYKSPNSSLEAICLNYLAGPPSSLTLDTPAHGKKRLLVKLYPDQYEVVRQALDEVGEVVDTDEKGLLLMCRWFVITQSSGSNHNDG